MTKTTERKSIVLFIFLLVNIFICISMQSVIRPAIQDGLKLCYQVLIPSLLPSLVFSNIIADLDLHLENNKISKLFATLFSSSPYGLMPYLVGLVCGFPVGAKHVCELRKNGYISEEEGNHLLGFSNNCGAAFCITGLSILRKNLKEGIAIYLIQILVSLLISFITKPKKESITTGMQNQKLVKSSSISISSSISSAMFSMLSICTTVCFFKMISTCASQFLPDFIMPFISLILEVSSGLERVCVIFKTSGFSTFALCAAGICFGGISVFLQSLPYIEEAKLSGFHYISCKLLSAVIAYAISVIIFPFL